MARKRKAYQSQPTLSYDATIIIVVLFLLFAYPIGLILMFALTNWSKALKFIISLPLILGIVLFFLMILTKIDLLNFASAEKQNKETFCQNMCRDTTTNPKFHLQPNPNCYEECINPQSRYK